MQIDDSNIFDWIVGLFMAVIAWVTKKQIGAIERNRDDLDAHKLNVAENYIKKDVVDRIHSRLDEVGNDIKTIIGIVGNGNKK